jgi:regulator of protease activity HflC (stomatin/prohibitin superfamily)
MINRAEAEKQQAILKAEGEAAARMRNAEAEAIAIQKIAEAEGIAIQKVAEKLGNSGNPAQYLIAQKYIEMMKELSTGENNKTVFMPYEATSVMGSIGGIKELLKETK